jgi:uncharacterized protein YbgA (DUF1722 family)
MISAKSEEEIIVYCQFHLKLMTFIDVEMYNNISLLQAESAGASKPFETGVHCEIHSKLMMSFNRKMCNIIGPILASTSQRSNSTQDFISKYDQAVGAFLQHHFWSMFGQL